MSSDTPCIPVLNFANPDRDAKVKLLVEAMEKVGFVYMDNVPGYSLEIEEKLLQATKWFFAKPLEDKLRVSCTNWNKDAKGYYRGYIPINVKEGHLREQYEMGEELPEDDPDRNSANYLYEPTPFPDGEEGYTYRELMMSHYAAMTNAGIEFLRLLAKGLEVAEDFFDKKFLPKTLSSLRIMHYPTYGDTPQPTFVCEEHFDTPFVTILTTFAYSGLEIKNKNDEWVKVAPRPGSLVVNIGDLLSRVSRRRFKATWHRVRDTGGDRYSIPFFFEPRADAQFEFSHEDDLGWITYGSWMVNHMRRFKYQFGHLPEYPSDLPMFG
ncbi:uncharacterized protein LOC135345278 [Halichondria panicea]|uniref:uncharacterized protein LOC135345278 n=1 Tax=Halichondria panicea TaxID=6063 RepID=UPI00312BB7BB